MARFTKRPVTIDAILASEILDGVGSGRFSVKSEDRIALWVVEAFERGVMGFELDAVLINTPEGQMRGERADWIIRGVKGELYPCKPDIFAATYDVAKEPRSWETHGVRVTEGASTNVGRPEDFVQPWAVYRCDQAGADEACGIIEQGILGKRDVVSDTNREECCHHMRLLDANRIVELHNRQPITVLTIKGDMPPEQFAEFRKQWAASHSDVSSRMVLFDSDVERRQIVDSLYTQLDAAWGIIANAGGGDWKTQTQEWREAAERWRDCYTGSALKPQPSLTEQGRVWAEAWNAKAYQQGRDLNAPEPPPHVHPDMLPAWEKVIDDYRTRFSIYLNQDTHGDPVAIENALTVSDVLMDMRARDKIGREKYGVPLTPWNGRDQLVDAYQELLDAAVYVRAASMEGIPIPEIIYRHTLDDLTFLRRMITERAKDPRTS
jgi:hypothetical protein